MLDANHFGLVLVENLQVRSRFRHVVDICVLLVNDFLFCSVGYEKNITVPPTDSNHILFIGIFLLRFIND